MMDDDDIVDNLVARTAKSHKAVTFAEIAQERDRLAAENERLWDENNRLCGDMADLRAKIAELEARVLESKTLQEDTRQGLNFHYKRATNAEARLAEVTQALEIADDFLKDAYGMDYGQNPPLNKVRAALGEKQ